MAAAGLNIPTRVFISKSKTKLWFSVALLQKGGRDKLTRDDLMKILAANVDIGPCHFMVDGGWLKMRWRSTTGGLLRRSSARNWTTSPRGSETPRRSGRSRRSASMRLGPAGGEVAPPEAEQRRGDQADIAHVRRHRSDPKADAGDEGNEGRYR